MTGGRKRERTQKRNDMKVSDNGDGLFHGRLGDKIYYVVNGKQYVRLAPDKPDRYTPSEGQRRTNRRFKMTQQLYQFYKRRVSPDVWRTAARELGRRADNLFHSVNCQYIDGEGRMADPAHFQFSAGPLSLPRDIEVVSLGGGRYRATWRDERDSATAAATDELRVGVLYDDELLEFNVASEVSGRRGDGGGEFRIDAERGTAHLYLYFARADGSAYSPPHHVHTATRGDCVQTDAHTPPSLSPP